MSDLYRKAKVGRLTFKGGDVAATKSIDKKKKKKMKKKHLKANSEEDVDIPSSNIGGDLEGGEEVVPSIGESENIYTIDAAKKMKYEELFPVESRKFGYDPKNKSRAASNSNSVEEALDDRVKKKADRYCK